MSKINMKGIQDLIKKIQDTEKKAITRKVAESAGKAMTDEMLSLIDKGISPIRGAGRFPGYLRSGDKDGYPANKRKRYPAKRDRPVNLKLSESFLKALEFRAVSSKGSYNTEIGFYDPREVVKEEGHRDGANGQPKRPVIPQGKEEFAVSVQEKALEVLEEAVSSYVKKL